MNPEAKVFVTKKPHYAGRVIACTWEESEAKAALKGETVIGILVEVIPVEYLRKNEDRR